MYPPWIEGAHAGAPLHEEAFFNFYDRNLVLIGKTAAAYQHLVKAVMRCVENHVCLARAANTGISAFIDARGQILWKSEIYVPEAHSLELPLMPGGSLYTKIGDILAWTCSSSPAWP